MVGSVSGPAHGRVGLRFSPSSDPDSRAAPAMLPFFPVPMDVAQNASVQARVEERARTGNDVTAEETELNPQARYDLIWQGGQSHFVALYQPRLVYTHTFKRPTIDPTVVSPDTVNQKDPNDTPMSALHNVGVGLELLRPRWRLSAYQFFAYGPMTTTTLLAQNPWNGGEVPVDPLAMIPSTIAARFTLLFVQTQIFAPIRLSRRVSLTPGFVYNSFGGADSASRATMALTAGPGANLTLEVAATPNDRLLSVVGGGRVSTSFEGDRTGPLIYRSEASQTWRHWFSRNLSSELTGGGTLGGDEISGFAVYANALAALMYDDYGMPKFDPGAPPWGGQEDAHGNHLQLAVVAKATPWLDFFSGTLEERAVGIVAANYTADRTTFRGEVSAAKVVNTPESVAKYSLFQVESSLRYRIASTFSIDGGVRFGIQSFENAIRSNDMTQTTVFAGLLWTPLPARF